jgi:hypothetical protein
MALCPAMNVTPLSAGDLAWGSLPASRRQGVPTALALWGSTFTSAAVVWIFVMWD